MQPKKILLVDDEPLVRRSLEKTLLRAGFDVDTAADVNQGLDLFKVAETNQTPFDMAVLDINMPDFDGMERSGAGLDLLSKIKEIRQDIHIIMLTAYDEVNKAKDAVGRGAQAYFVKGREQGLVELINETFEL
jgi:two-component system nitrogen regulation response regulator GlnG